MIVAQEIPVVWHNESNLEFHFIVKHSSERFKENEIDCLCENTEKYMFSSGIKKDCEMETDTKIKSKPI